MPTFPRERLMTSVQVASGMIPTICYWHAEVSYVPKYGDVSEFPLGSRSGWALGRRRAERAAHRAADQILREWST